MMAGCADFEKYIEHTVIVPNTPKGFYEIIDINTGAVLDQDTYVNQNNMLEVTFEVDQDVANIEFRISEGDFMESHDPSIQISLGRGETFSLAIDNSEASTVVLTPITHLASCFARAKASTEVDQNLSQYLQKMFTRFEELLGLDGIKGLQGQNFIRDQMEAAQAYGFYLKAFSHLSYQYFTSNPSTDPSLQINTLGLLQKLCADYEGDLKLDGQGKEGAILHGGTQVGVSTLTTDLSSSLEAYIRGDFTDINLEPFKIKELQKPLLEFSGEF